jgi:hypothetical protein
MSIHLTNKPIGAVATIQWLDRNNQPEPGEVREGYYFSFSESPDFEELEKEEVVLDQYGVPDDSVFFYCDGVHELDSFKSPGTVEFVVLDYQLEFID